MLLLFLTALTTSIVLFLGFLVFFHDPKSFTNRFFLILTLANFIWLVFNDIALSVDPGKALLWIRLVLLFGTWGIFAFFLFVLNFPSVELTISKKSLYFLIGWMLILGALILTPYAFVRISVVNDGPVPIPGGLMPYIGSSLIIVTIITFVMIIKKYIKADTQERKQWKYISAGLSGTYLLVLGLIFWRVNLYHDSTFAAYAPLYLIPMIVGAAYAILRHKLLNIKVVGTEILSFILLFVSVWQILFARNTATLLLQIGVTILVLIFCIFLVRSVLHEVKQREELEILSKQLELANKRLQELDKAKTEFLSVASHQLRTPLTAIKGYVSMILEGDYGPTTDIQHETLKNVFESAQRLVFLINDLLDLSRIESGRMEFDFVALDLNEMIKSVITELKQKAEQKHLYLYFDAVNNRCPKIKADEEKMRQVVMNLIDNAVKYTLSGGVTVRLHSVEKQLRLEIVDTGIGVALEDQPKLFQQFYRTEQANEVTREGTGLGIYVVKKIVEAHHGKIWFESAGKNKGTTFFVNLPLPEGPIVEERVKISALEAI